MDENRCKSIKTGFGQWDTAIDVLVALTGVLFGFLFGYIASMLGVALLATSLGIVDIRSRDQIPDLYWFGALAIGALGAITGAILGGWLALGIWRSRNILSD